MSVEKLILSYCVKALNDLIAQYGKSCSLVQNGSGHGCPCTYFESMDFLLPILFRYISSELFYLLPNAIHLTSFPLIFIFFSFYLGIY